MRERREKPRRAALWLLKSSSSPVFECYFLIHISTTGGKKKGFLYVHPRQLLQASAGGSGGRKDDGWRNFFALRYSFPFLCCVKGRKQPPPRNAMEFYYCACCCLCLSGCVFSWLESQVLVQRRKKKMKGYFVRYRCREVFVCFFFFLSLSVFFSLYFLFSSFFFFSLLKTRRNLK